MIKLFGQPVGDLNPAKRRALGLTFVPEERLGRGAVPPMSLAYNALLTGARKGMVQNGMIHPTVMRTLFQERHRALQGQMRRRAIGRLQPVGRQSAEIHRRARDDAAAQDDDRGAADLGCRCRRGAVDPAGADRSARPGRRAPGDIRGTRRALHDQRPARGAGRGAACRPRSSRPRRRSNKSAPG